MKEDKRTALDVAALAGSILLESGAEIFRVEETIDRIAKAYRVESGESFVLSSGLFLTAGSEREEYFAKVKSIPLSGARLDRVTAVNQLSREIEKGNCTAQQAREELEKIRRSKGKPNWARILSSGVGSACFCFLFGGDLLDCLVAFAAGLLLYTYLIYGCWGKLKLSKLMTNITGSFLVTLFSLLLYSLGIGHHLNEIVIGSIIPLVPGLAFTSAIRDMADEDYIAGAVRMLDALLVTFCIALGVGAVFLIYRGLLGGAMP